MDWLCNLTLTTAKHLKYSSSEHGILVSTEILRVDRHSSAQGGKRCEKDVLIDDNYKTATKV